MIQQKSKEKTFEQIIEKFKYIELDRLNQTYNNFYNIYLQQNKSSPTKSDITVSEADFNERKSTFEKVPAFRNKDFTQY